MIVRFGPRGVAVVPRQFLWDIFVKVEREGFHDRFSILLPLRRSLGFRFVGLYAAADVRE